jgi:chemotaxis regulatin CheY-phosphate phosphatase CheZ
MSDIRYKIDTIFHNTGPAIEEFYGLLQKANPEYRKISKYASLKNKEWSALMRQLLGSYIKLKTIMSMAKKEYKLVKETIGESDMTDDVKESLENLETIFIQLDFTELDRQMLDMSDNIDI